MAKPEIKTNPRVKQIFDDLEKYQDFCVSFGYPYNEADLYSQKSFAFRQHTKFLQGKPAKDCWAELIASTKF